LLPDLFWPNARDFPPSRRVEDRCPQRGELKRIPIAAGYYGSAVGALLNSHRSGKKIVRLVSGSFDVRKPKCGDKFR
jgi:hypothetical protein